MNCIVIGASSGLGRALSIELARSGHSLFLVSSDKRDLEAVAADCKVRSGISVTCLAEDLSALNVSTLREAALAELKTVDALFVVAGVLDDAEQGPIDDDSAKRLCDVNFTAAVRIINSFVDHIRNNPSARLVVISSIAATRPRAFNSIYGATKAGLEFYSLGVRHLLASGNAHVQIYRLGYMHSQMTFGKQPLLPPITPELAAHNIVSNLDGKCGILYLPTWWRWVMLVYKLIPWPIYRRIRVR